MEYNTLVKPICWIMGFIFICGWGFTIPSYNIYPEHRGMGDDSGKILLFLIYVAVSEYGKRLDQNYKCPVYCAVDHKHILWGQDGKKDEKETYIQTDSRLHTAVRDTNR